MRVQVLQHVPFESVGSMESWFSKRDTDVGYTRFYNEEALPDPKTIDLIVAMGGPMSVNDEGSYPWLKPEKRFIRAVIDLGVPVVGVCLGAQLIASALDAQVAACRHKEIGWFPINGVDGGGKTFRFPPRVNVFHWHGETFDLPRGAKRIASNAVCANQGFQVGANVIGLQFHLETTPETADLICHHCRDELVDGPYIQSADTISASPESVYSEINNLMDEVLTYVTR